MPYKEKLQVFFTVALILLGFAAIVVGSVYLYGGPYALIVCGGIAFGAGVWLMFRLNE